MNEDQTIHGVCRLSLVSMRAYPTDHAEQISQLLFGDHYEVCGFSPERDWVKIRCAFDQYEGWISAKQHHAISPEYFEYINRADFRITTDLVSSILYNKVTVPIVIGSIIPISASELFRMEEQFAFNGESKSLGQKRDVEFMLGLAKKYINAPYQWGGRSPFGIDCSGFVQTVFKMNGYTLPRDAGDQFTAGKEVAIDDAQPGDLAFFYNDKKVVTHVGIVLGEQKIIHASGKVRIDHLNAEGILNVETKIYTHLLTGVRRIIL